MQQGGGLFFRRAAAPRLWAHVGAHPGVDWNARCASWTERGLHFDPRTLQVVLFGGMGLIRSRYEHQLTTGSSSRTSRAL
jgi:hypothetical protein